MTNTKGILTLITLATILIAGGLTIAPVAYSTGSGDDSQGKGCGDDSHGDDSHGDDSHGDDCIPEPDCECEKPTVFSVIYNGPGIEGGMEGTTDAEVTVEIYKKVDHIGEKDPLLTIEGIFDGESIIIDSNVYGKKKINSNTVYRVIQNDVEIAVISVHTSCSQSLFIGDIYSDGQVTVTVESGFDHKERQSIFLPVDPICNEVPVIIPATITLKKVITQDNTDELLEIADEDIASNFPLFITNILPGSEAIPIIMEKQEVPSGTYTLGEDMPEKFEFVLITGDADCPTVLDMEEFTISEGEHLTCVIYNDDDADAATGGQGVAFGFNGFDFTVTTPNGPVTGLNTCASQPLGQPCIEKNGILYVIVDPLLVNVNNSIIVWSMTPMAGSPTNQVNNCSLTSIIPSMGHLGENGFALFCSTVVAGTWNINYAFINT